MIIWGGYTPGSYVNTGGRYSPSTDTWTAVGNIDGAPTSLEATTQEVGAGPKLFVGGGFDQDLVGS